MITQDERSVEVASLWKQAKDAYGFIDQLLGGLAEFQDWNERIKSAYLKEAQADIKTFQREIKTAINSEGYTAIAVTPENFPLTIRTVGMPLPAGVQYYSPSRNAERCYNGCDIFGAVSFVVFRED